MGAFRFKIIPASCCYDTFLIVLLPQYYQQKVHLLFDAIYSYKNYLGVYDSKQRILSIINYNFNYG